MDGLIEIVFSHITVVKKNNPMTQKGPYLLRKRGKWKGTWFLDAHDISLYDLTIRKKTAGFASVIQNKLLCWFMLAAGQHAYTSDGKY